MYVSTQTNKRAIVTLFATDAIVRFQWWRELWGGLVEAACTF